jgi:hypothetical protein
MTRITFSHGTIKCERYRSRAPLSTERCVTGAKRDPLGPEISVAWRVEGDGAVKRLHKDAL